MKEKFTAIVKGGFSAAHHLPGYDGDCCRIHGHNWDVEVAVSRMVLDDVGLSTDLREVKRVLRELMAKLDHTDLNKNDFLEGKSPTAENIAKILYVKFQEAFPEAVIDWLEVHEGPNSSVRYSLV